MKLTPKEVGLLVQRALCLEALADKQGCTTRYIDLEGRPLEGFIVAGINIGPSFELFAKDWLSGRETRLFHRFVAALKASNRHKSDKYINFGLLEILFPTVAARLTCDDPAGVVPRIIELMKTSPKSDVVEMVRARELAWSTSEKGTRKLADISLKARAATHPFGYYDAVMEGDPHGSAAQWIEDYRAGLPMLREQFEHMRRSDESILAKIKEAYDPVRAKNPDIRAGILADMSAAAIFLHLSYLPE